MALYPTDPQIAAIEIQSIYPTLVSVAISLKRQARTRGTQRWLLRIKYPPLSQADVSKVYAFCLSQQGQYGTFTFRPPYTPLGSIPGSPTVQSVINTRTVRSQGWTASQTGVLKAGDYISFADHNKVYIVVADVDSDGSGIGDISIEPALLSTPSASTVINVQNIDFTCALSDDQQTYSRAAPYNDLYLFETSFIEVP